MYFLKLTEISVARKRTEWALIPDDHFVLEEQ